MDRVGTVTGTVDDTRRRDVEDISAWARASASAESFLARFKPGAAGKRRREVLETFRTVLFSEVREEMLAESLYRLLRHFTLLKFDLLHEGATDQAHAIERLRSQLRDGTLAEALWDRLRVIAREGAGTAREFDRKALLLALGGRFRLAGAPSLRHALACVGEETRNALATIPVDVDGIVIGRSTLLDEARDILSRHRFVHVIGLPGTGKSSVLRQFAESLLDQGTTLVLKSDRLVGPNWAAHARSLGINAVGLDVLLTEIAATGNPVLFIDGLDRIEIPDRGVVFDLVNTILASPALAAWKIVATSRDNGIEPLRTWLPPEIIREEGVGTVAVGPFDETEAAELAERKPALRPLLLGNERVSEIARRPFFAAVLARSLAHAKPGQAAPRSEIELIEAWWHRGGGHDANETLVYNRQRTLIALAKTGAAALGRRIGLDGLDLTAVRELKRDDIIRDVRAGHTVGFAHDIFFEWAFLHLLLDRDEAWIAEIQAVGEPPVLGRVVELLSQAGLTDVSAWEADLARLEAAAIRPQWARAWLLAPFVAPTFRDAAAGFTAAVTKDGGRRLAKLAVWFQAEKTRANPLVLEGKIDTGRLSRIEILRTADALAWPSDVAAWNRFCSWALLNVQRFPVDAIPDLVSAFEVWQYMLADVPNAVSQRIIATTTRWLEDIEDREHAEELRFDQGAWKDLRHGELSELEQRFRNLLLRAARVEQARVGAYLHRVLTKRHLRHHAFRFIAAFAPTLASHHAKELVALTLAEVNRKLPAETAARPERGRIPSNGFSYHDWQRLSINDPPGVFCPPSPLREPFASLFKAAPEEALALVRDLTNHAITAWQQLFTYDRSRRGTPLPLILTFPWGQQEFCGTQQTYMWSRGQWAPHPIACGLMALEQWAFGEIERGHRVDEVIECVLQGHQSCAVLSIAVILALSRRRLSAVTLPLATSQMIWKWDIARLISDRSGETNLIGFIRPADLPHAEAVRASNQRKERRLEVRSLASLFVLSGDEHLREAAQAAIKAFPKNLPLGFREEADDQQHVAELRRTAEIWSEMGKIENYAVTPAPDGSGVYIEMRSPTAADPDVVAVQERQARIHGQLTLLNWVNQSLEETAVEVSLSVAEAIAQAKAIDKPDLFDIPHETADPDGTDQSAVAGVAAITLLFGGELGDAELVWAQKVVFRAAGTPEKRDASWFAGSKLLYHPSVYAVSGLEGLIRKGIDLRASKHALLQLGGHPLEEVSHTAIGAALGLWETDAQLAWAALNLGIHISTASRHAMPSAYGHDHSTQPDRISAAVSAAIEELDQAEPRLSLEPVPPAWVFAPFPEQAGMPGRKRHNSKPVWRDADEFLRWDFLPKVLARVPIVAALADTLRRPAFLSWCYELLDWTNERLNPPWNEAGADRRDRRTSELIEWRGQIMWFLAQAALLLPAAEVHERMLTPIFAHDDEIAASLIRPFVNRIAAAGIVDPPEINPNAPAFMDACMTRILRDRMWENARHREGDIYGYDVPDIVRTFLFVAVENAPAAARFANRDWRDAAQVLPSIDRFVRAVGDIPHVMGCFLTLCERSLVNYPAEPFVEQIGVALQSPRRHSARLEGNDDPGPDRGPRPCLCRKIGAAGALAGAGDVAHP